MPDIALGRVDDDRRIEVAEEMLEECGDYAHA
jgi:hypothetical protein